MITFYPLTNIIAICLIPGITTIDDIWNSGPLISFTYILKKYSYCIHIYLMQQHPVTHGNSNIALLILTPISNISSFTKRYLQKSTVLNCVQVIHNLWYWQIQLIDKYILWTAYLRLLQQQLSCDTVAIIKLLCTSSNGSYLSPPPTYTFDVHAVVKTGAYTISQLCFSSIMFCTAQSC